MIYHILNGDALYHNLPLLEGVCIVMRECFIDGPVDDFNLENFIKGRSKFISNFFGIDQSEYLEKSKAIYDTVHQLSPKDKVYLWFEDDLFCQTNLWWWCYELDAKGVTEAHLVRPNHDNWSGFGIMSETELKDIYQTPISLDKTDLANLSKIWIAYTTENYDMLKESACSITHIIPRIAEIIQAHIDRKRKKNELGAPELKLKSIKESGVSNFGEAYKIFSDEMGIYGYGDLQIRKMWDRL